MKLFTAHCKDCNALVATTWRFRPLELGDMSDHQHEHGRIVVQAGDVLRHYTVTSIDEVA